MPMVLICAYADKPWRSRDTYERIETSLQRWWNVVSLAPRVEKDLRDDLEHLRRRYGDHLFVFNIAEYLDEARRRGFIPAVLDELGIPHLGSPADVVMRGLDKAATKRALQRHGVPTPRFFVAERVEGCEAVAFEIGYPLIVKPLHEGGHLGVDERSVVKDPDALREAVSRVLIQYHQPALVEAYINGCAMREFSVGVLADDEPVLLPVEIDYDAMPVRVKILTHEMAQHDLEQIKPVAEPEVAARVCDLAWRAFRALGARDYCRVDLRMDAETCYVLEVNVMPGLGALSFLPQAAQMNLGLSYEELIERLAEIGLRRCGVEP